MTKNNKGNLFVFEVGPSVKFVSAIKDAIFNNKNWGQIVTISIKGNISIFEVGPSVKFVSAIKDFH